jgi:hypothetical protein
MPLTMKQMKSLGEKKLVLIKTQLMTVIRNLSAGQSVPVDTEIGSFQIIGVPGSGLMLQSVGGHRGGIFDEDYFAAKVRTLIPRKNEQLDYDADRRVLLIGNAIAMTFESEITRLAILAAITNFGRSSPKNVSNIDEIYVDLGINKIELAYSRQADRASRRLILAQDWLFQTILSACLPPVQSFVRESQWPNQEEMRAGACTAIPRLALPSLLGI